MLELQSGVFEDTKWECESIVLFTEMMRNQHM